MELKKKKVNFLGDSITQGCCASEPELGFVQTMKQLYDFSEARNYGIGGTRIARQRIPSEDPRYDLDFCSRAPDMEKDADIIIVFGGTNDHGHGDAPMGTFHDRTPDTFRGACHCLFSSLTERYPQARIVVLTPLHRVGDCDPKGAQGWILQDYAESIQSIAKQYELPVLDLFQKSAINTRLSVLTTDGLHPNDAGHAILAREIGDFLIHL